MGRKSQSVMSLMLFFRTSVRTCVMLCVCFSLLNLTACSNQSSDFPSIPTISTESSVSESIQPSLSASEEETFPVIQMASPFSQDTLNYLSRLYSAKSQGLLGAGVNGDNVSLSFLDSVDPPFVVEAISTPATGATKDTILDWNNSNAMPDVFYSASLYASFENEISLSLNPYLSNDSLLNPTNIYIGMFNVLSTDGDFFGIPLMSSVEIIYINQEIFRTSDTELPSFVMDSNSFQKASENISDYFDNSELPPSYPFYRVEDLLPFLGASYADSYHYMSFDKTTKTFVPGFEDSVRFLKRYAELGYSIDLLSEEDKLELFGTFDPIISKRIAMWAGDSSDVMRWANYMPYTLQMVQIPSDEVGVITPPCLTVYPLCVSATTNYPELASKFAAFIALDEDAILLRLRLEGSEGFLPTVKSNRVWTRYFENATYSSPLLYYKEYMNHAYFSPKVSDQKLYGQFLYLLRTYSQDLLSEELSNDILKEMADVLLSA